MNFDVIESLRHSAYAKNDAGSLANNVPLAVFKNLLTISLQ